jgi:phosphatidylinositol alpha-1,6-mannosyltransferase
MKFLIVTSNYPRWRGDKTTPFVHNFAKQLVANGHIVRVLAPHYKSANSKEEYEGVEVRRFRYLLPESAQTVCYQGGALGNLAKKKLNKLKLPILVAFEFLAVLKQLLFWKPDVVNSHWLLPQGFVCALAAKLTGTKHIATVHGGDVFALNSPLMCRLKTFAIDQATLVTVNSSVTEAKVKEIAPNSTTPLLRLPTGILPIPELDGAKINALKESLQKCPDEKLILFAGRLSEEKGVREAILAVKKLLEESRNLRLLIIGEGHDMQTFQQLSKSLKLENSIDFLGWVPNQELYYYFSIADVFVGPSKKAANGWVEAQGLTFIEAMLAGCPVIGSNSGGIIDAVIPGKTGWLVEPNDADSLATAVEKVLFTETGSVASIVQYAKDFAYNTYRLASTVSKFTDAINSQSECKNDR